MMPVVDRCPIGIEGLDNLISGGFPRNRTILIAGSCGTGKSIFGVEFLNNGAVKFNEPGVLVSLEQNPELLKTDMIDLGYDLNKIEKDGKLRIIDGSLSKRGAEAIIKLRESSPTIKPISLPEKFTIEDIGKKTIEVAKQINAKRVVIDSISSIDEIMCGSNVRATILNLHYTFQDAGLTTLMIFDAIESESVAAKEGVEEYVADGVLLLKMNEALDTRTIRIKKLRATKHTLKPHVFELTSKGIKLK